ncbi:hypothetical protein COOONC_12720 [Cooperia oncophora]
MNFSSSAILRMPLNRDMKRILRNLIIQSLHKGIVRHSLMLAIAKAVVSQKIDILAEMVSNLHAQKQSVDRLLVVPGKLAVPALYTTQILSLMVNLKQVHKIWTSVRSALEKENMLLSARKADTEIEHAENCPANPHNHVRSKILTANNTCDQATMNSNSTTPKQSKKSNSSTPKQSKIPVSTTPTSVCRGHGSFTASTISSAIKSATQKVFQILKFTEYSVEYTISFSVGHFSD